MSYNLDLTGCYAKVNRAIEHVEALRTAILQASPDREILVVNRKYERERGAIVYYIERMVNVPEYWGLLGNASKPGDEIMVVPVVATGPDPDVRFEGSSTGFIAIREGMDVTKAFDAIAHAVASALEQFVTAAKSEP